MPATFYVFLGQREAQPSIISTNRQAFSAFALPHEISQIITDTGVLPSIVTELRERGITVTLV